MKLPWQQHSGPHLLTSTPNDSLREVPESYNDEIYQQLLTWRDMYCRTHRIGSNHVLTNSQLKVISNHAPTTLKKWKQLGLDELREDLFYEPVTAIVDQIINRNAALKKVTEKTSEARDLDGDGEISFLEFAKTSKKAKVNTQWRGTRLADSDGDP